MEGEREKWRESEMEGEREGEVHHAIIISLPDNWFPRAGS